MIAMMNEGRVGKQKWNLCQIGIQLHTFPVQLNNKFDVHLYRSHKVSYSVHLTLIG